MFVSPDRRLLYALVVPSSIIILGGIIWYYNRRKSSKNNFYILIAFRFFLDEQIRLNRSEYLVLEVQVPDYCVGSIIGKGGEVIKRVRLKSTKYFMMNYCL
jgi:hypothetical protein